MLNYLAGIKQNLRLSIVVSIILVILLTCTGQAVVPYDSYIYNFWQAPVPAPQAYVFEAVVYGTDLGVGGLSIQVTFSLGRIITFTSWIPVTTV